MKIQLSFVILSLCCAAASPAAVRVVTSTTDLAAIAREVGGDRVTVQSIAEGTEDPHFVPPKPSFMLDLRRADLFVQVGLSLEIGWVPPLLQGARNGRIQPGGPAYVDASVGIRRLEVPSVISRAQGDVHPYGNPHYWLDPLNGEVIARNIVHGLERVDPEGKGAYEENLKRFTQRLEEKTREWTEALAPYRGKPVVSYHRTWPYLEDRFRIVFAGELEPLPGIPPSPKHLAELTSMMEQEGIHAIVYAPYYNSKPVQELSSRTGARAVLLPTSVGGVPGTDDYFSFFDVIVGRLREALAAGGPDVRR